MNDSTRIVVSSPLSFGGSRRRLENLMPEGMGWLAWATCLIPLAWALITCWYVLLALGLWLVVVPWRLLRRGARKRKLADARHEEMLAALRQGQMQ